MAYTDIDKPSDYFRTKLYAGNATNNRAITWDETDTNMQPNMLWFKSRTDTQTHGIWDSARGALSRLIPSANAAEGDEANDLDSFDTNGFTVDSAANMNGNSRNYVTWGWKAGTSFTNDASATGIGTIDSTGSASDTSGFSIVSYTGTGSAGTIKHGLSSVPYMIIVKKRSASGSWNVYHSTLGNTKAMQLDLTSTPDTNSGYWNNTSPTSSVLSLGTSAQVNGSGVTYIGYIFSEKQAYSKFGSYTGNGNADGTFVYTGFKPAWVMVKASGAATNWTIIDNKRPEYNPANKWLYSNVSDAEYNASEFPTDFTAQGFKIRNTGSYMNTSGGTYIFMAFASNPFVTSTGVPATAR